MTHADRPARGHRPAFEAALRLFARLSTAMVARGFAPPVLVGGGAVELYTGGAIATGDFDVVTARQEEFECVLKEAGFVKPEGLGHTPLGWVHPELSLGFEIVSATLLDGMADRDRLVRLDTGSDGVAAILSIEDMIADRLGQYASGSAPDMLAQARMIFAFHPQLDLAYLQDRIRYETGGELDVDALRP